MHDTPVEPRRRLLAFGALALIAPAVRAASPRVKPTIEVWKSPTCGCCKDWITHVEAAGFAVKVHTDGNTDARQRLGIPLALGSCHTARVDGYALEGHVPARELQRLLRERPNAIGLAVPAMPVGSPGMDGPEYGGRRDPFDVLLVGPDGRHGVYASYR